MAKFSSYFLSCSLVLYFIATTHNAYCMNEFLQRNALINQQHWYDSFAKRSFWATQGLTLAWLDLDMWGKFVDDNCDSCEHLALALHASSLTTGAFSCWALYNAQQIEHRLQL